MQLSMPVIGRVRELGRTDQFIIETDGRVDLDQRPPHAPTTHQRRNRLRLGARRAVTANAPKDVSGSRPGIVPDLHLAHRRVNSPARERMGANLTPCCKYPKKTGRIASDRPPVTAPQLRPEPPRLSSAASPNGTGAASRTTTR